MKITKKILQDIIKEELANVLQEQDPIETKREILQKMDDEIAAVEKQLKSAKKQSDNKANIKRLQDKLKKLKEKLKKKEADLAGPGENADQAPKETKK